MSTQLENFKVAILAENGFEQSELLEPQKALEQAGAQTFILSPQSNTIRGWSAMNWGEEVKVDIQLSQANANDYDALLLPGGVINPDKLRLIPEAINFVKQFFAQKKPIAAICHGPWLLVEADIVKEHTLTSWPSIKTDILNAGGHWIDQAVVVDAQLITSRQPKDIPAFNEKIIHEFSQKQAVALPG